MTADLRADIEASVRRIMQAQEEGWLTAGTAEGAIRSALLAAHPVLLDPCRDCGDTNPTDHVYAEQKCCPDCDHRPAPAGDLRERVAGVLHAHQMRTFAVTATSGCRCGWTPSGSEGFSIAHRAHQADAVMALLGGAA